MGLAGQVVSSINSFLRHVRLPRKVDGQEDWHHTAEVRSRARGAFFLSDSFSTYTMPLLHLQLVVS